MPTEPGDRVAAVVLAAGAARRFGAAKLLMPFGASTVLGSVVAAIQAADLDPIVVVAGSHAPAIAGALSTTRARIVRNPQPTRGMLSSVCVGLSALPADIDRFLLALADQPAIQAEDISHLLREHLRSGRAIALPTYHGKRGHPVVFHSRCRQQILALDTSQTLRDFIHSHPDDIAEVEASSDSVIRDIDTPAQYRNELRQSPSQQ